MILFELCSQEEPRDQHHHSRALVPAHICQQIQFHAGLTLMGDSMSHGAALTCTESWLAAQQGGEL